MKGNFIVQKNNKSTKEKISANNQLMRKINY